MQHLVVEPQIVETDDQVGALQIRDEIVHLFLAVNLVIAARGAERHADAHAHVVMWLQPPTSSADFLRFQIEINNVLHVFTQ